MLGYTLRLGALPSPVFRCYWATGCTVVSSVVVVAAGVTGCTTVSSVVVVVEVVVGGSSEAQPDSAAIKRQGSSSFLMSVVLFFGEPLLAPQSKHRFRICLGARGRRRGGRAFSHDHFCRDHFAVFRVVIDRYRQA